MTCLWKWAGNGWVNLGGCPEGQSCLVPDFDGTYIGQAATTACEGPH